jgi:lactoylglutathione lyase
MNEPRLNLLVIRTADIDRARAFYGGLGLSLGTQQHGNGPPHLVAMLGGTVFEIYPAKDAADVDRTTRLGFTVTDLAGRVDRCRQAGATIVQEPRDTPWGRRAVVRDPDGRAVELQQETDVMERARAIDGATIGRRIANVIFSIYSRPEMYVPPESGFRALDGLLHMLHFIWGDAVGRGREVSELHVESLVKLGIGSSKAFQDHVRRANPNATDEDVLRYVIAHWRKISLALGMIDSRDDDREERQDA